MAIEVEEMPLALPTPTEWEKLLRPDDISGPYVVIIYNDDWHTFPEVICQVRKATGCSLDKANQVTNEIHEKGRAIAYAGSKEKCEEVAGILREIRLTVETTRAV
jgi:ATP-dependent Clp protease adaptor protein ClpS